MKKLFSIVIILFVVLGITSLIYGKNNKSHEKATGGVTIEYGPGDHIAFNAHETVAGCIGKGMVSHSGQRGNDHFVYHFKVKYVMVVPDDNAAWFAGRCTHATNGENVGRWINYVVYDEPDALGYQWVPENGLTPEEQEEKALNNVCDGYPSIPSDVIEGNLRIHP